jgi:hydrogenase/urease nickel incorporation metallochaperone HypA/AIR synthase related protein
MRLGVPGKIVEVYEAAGLRMGRVGLGGVVKEACLDRALAIATRPEVTFVSFGDMLRVPGSASDLLRVKSAGGDVRVVYFPLDAVRLGQARPDREVVFFGIGFETTAAANAMAIRQAARLGLRNFSMLVSHVLVPPAIRGGAPAGRSRDDRGLDARGVPGGGRAPRHGRHKGRQQGQRRPVLHQHCRHRRRRAPLAALGRSGRPGDLVILSGTIGDHGMAVMSRREGLEFETEITSDTAPLWALVATLLEKSSEVRCLRDPTRGELASTVNELALASGVGIELEEAQIPVRPAVYAACELLGLDPLYVANEGKLVAIVGPSEADAVVARMRGHPLGTDASVIGVVTDAHPRMVVMRMRVGGTRVVDLHPGEILPRIC